jgi:hypothetical protein
MNITILMEQLVKLPEEGVPEEITAIACHETDTRLAKQKRETYVSSSDPVDGFNEVVANNEPDVEDEEHMGDDLDQLY